MASKTFAMSSSKSWVAGQVVVSSSSNGSEKNSSNITITLQGRRTDGGKSYNAFASNFYIAIDGVIVATDTNGCTVSGTSWQNILTYSETIDHNNDGTKSITITVGGNITETSFSFNETSSTFDLDSIPRYATITKFENIGVTQTTATFDWWCDVGCSALQYKIGNGDWIDSNGIPFTVTGLSPGTTYNIKINVKRADSGLWTESSAVSITTEPIAILTDASGFKFDIGEDLSFAVNYADKNDSIAKVYYLNSDNIWTLFENTFDELTFAVGTTDITFSFSENADLLYSLCPNSNELSIKIDFGTILDEVEYFNSYIGTACVTNSNPIFTNFICENIDSTTIDILGEENKTYIPSGHGLMRISIDNNTSKAIAQNFATIKYYDVSVLHPNGYTFIQRNIDEVNQDITIDISGLTAVGEYKAKVVAWDSRNNCSEEVVRSFYVIDYHAPNTVINASRLNGFDSEILLQFTSTYSLLLLNSVAYNEIISIKYRTQSVEDLIWSDYVELTGDNIVQDGSADGTIVISRNKDNILTRLSSDYAHNMEFVVTDKLGTYIYPIISLDKGVPNVAESDDGYFAIGMLPDWDSEAKLQVATDIMATDKDGNRKLILDEIDTKYDQVKNEIDQVMKQFAWYPGYPDYSNIIEQHDDEGFTVSEDGWLSITGYAGWNSSVVHVNGIIVFTNQMLNSNGYPMKNTGMIPVKKGDVITAVISTEITLPVSYTIRLILYGMKNTVADSNITQTEADVLQTQINQLSSNINTLFKFQALSKSVTVGAKTSLFVKMADYSCPEGYTFVGILPCLGGFADQWQVSFTKYGDDGIYAQIYSYYAAQLSSTISCRVVFMRTDLMDNMHI